MGTVPHSPAARRLVEGVRALLRVSVELAAPEAVLADAAGELEALVARLVPHTTAPPPRFPGAVEALRDPGEFMPYDPVLGRLSPLAPPIAFASEDGKAVGRVCFTRPYEGPPGCVHGGVIAAAFDQTLGVANLFRGAAGPTATLTVRYRRPTPLGVEVRFEGWQTRLAGTRIHTEGRLLACGRVTAEASGLFVLLPAERVMKLLGD